jgi:hypothetical protein
VKRGESPGLNPVEKSGDRDFNSLGYSHESFNGYDFFTTLDFANVLRVQVNQFGEPLLSETRPFAIITNGSPNDFPVGESGFLSFARFGHRPTKVGWRPISITPATCWYLLLPFEKQFMQSRRAQFSEFCYCSTSESQYHRRSSHRDFRTRTK